MNNLSQYIDLISTDCLLKNRQTIMTIHPSKKKAFLFPLTIEKQSFRSMTLSPQSRYRALMQANI